MNASPFSVTDLLRVISQILTSQLLTDAQIRNITSGIAGNFFSEWFATPRQERETAEKVEAARSHIGEATAIISSIRADLDKQAEQLTQLVQDIEGKRKEAEHYTTLAKTNQEAFGAFRAEMERTIRDQLVEQANKDKILRRIVSFSLWLVTLVAGAALGAYFPSIVSYVRA